MSSENGGKSTIIEVFKTIITSPVGGWVSAMLVVVAMAWVTFKDRQAVYQDLARLRESAMPLIRENNELLKDILIEVRRNNPQ